MRIDSTLEILFVENVLCFIIKMPSSTQMRKLLGS